MEKDITRVGPRMRKVQNKEKLMQLPLVVANFIKDVIAMRIEQKANLSVIVATQSTLEKLVDEELVELQKVIKIQLSDDLREIIDAYFEEAA